MEHPLMAKTKKPDTINPSTGSLEAEWSKGTLSECLFKAAPFPPPSPSRTQLAGCPGAAGVSHGSSPESWLLWWEILFLSSMNLSIIKLPQQWIRG